MPNLIANARTITDAILWSDCAVWIAFTMAIGVCATPNAAIPNHSHLIRLHWGRFTFSDFADGSVETTGDISGPN